MFKQMIKKGYYIASLSLILVSCYQSEDYRTGIVITYEGDIRNSSQIIAYRWMEEEKDTVYYQLDTASKSALIELGTDALTYILTLDSCFLFRDTLSEIQFSRDKRKNRILNFSYLLNGEPKNTHYLTLKMRL